MHESEKWKWSHSVVSDSQPPHGLQPTRLLHPWDFLRGIDFPASKSVGCWILTSKPPSEERPLPPAPQGWLTSRANIWLQRPGPLASVQDISEEPSSSRVMHRLAEASAASQSLVLRLLSPSWLLSPRAIPINPMRATLRVRVGLQGTLMYDHYYYFNCHLNWTSPLVFTAGWVLGPIQHMYMNCEYMCMCARTHSKGLCALKTSLVGYP